MRENRPYGSEGGASQTNGTSLPLCAPVKAFEQEGVSPFQVPVTGLNPTVVIAFS
jgi:hypothetical protein